MILHREIDKLKQQLMVLGALVEERFSMAIQATANRDQELARQVIDGDQEVDS